MDYRASKSAAQRELAEEPLRIELDVLLTVCCPAEGIGEGERDRRSFESGEQRETRLDTDGARQRFDEQRETRLGRRAVDRARQRFTGMNVRRYLWTVAIR